MKLTYSNVKSGMNMYVSFLIMIITGIILLSLMIIFYKELNDNLPSIKISEQQESIIGYWALPMVGSVFAIGFIAMAVIEFIKPFIRKQFYKAHFENWLQIPHKTAVSNRLKKYEVEIKNTLNSKKTFIELTIAGDTNLLYKLPVENLCGQLNNAAEMIIANPRKYPLLLLSLFGSNLDHLKYLDENIDIFNQSGEGDFINSRNRIAHLIQRNIDRLQISLSLKWKYLLKSYSIIFSIAVAIIGVAVFNQSTSMDSSTILLCLASTSSPTELNWAKYCIVQAFMDHDNMPKMSSKLLLEI